MRASRGEIKIEEILEEAGLPFKMEYIFPDFIIEYQGKQHYEASSKFGGKRGLYQQQYNDNQKRRFCALHDFRLIEIPYTDENLISYDYIMKLAGY